jgi:hypothetical protein
MINDTEYRLIRSWINHYGVIQVFIVICDTDAEYFEKHKEDIGALCQNELIPTLFYGVTTDGG